MPKEYTIHIADLIRRNVRALYASHRGLRVAIELANRLCPHSHSRYDVQRIAPGFDHTCDRDAIHQHSRKWSDGEHTESNWLQDSLKRADQTKVYIYEKPNGRIGIAFAFFDEDEEKPFVEIREDFDKQGEGSLNGMTGTP